MLPDPDLARAAHDRLATQLPARLVRGVMSPDRGEAPLPEQKPGTRPVCRYCGQDDPSMFYTGMVRTCRLCRTDQVKRASAAARKVNQSREYVPTGMVALAIQMINRSSVPLRSSAIQTALGGITSVSSLLERAVNERLVIKSRKGRIVFWSALK